MGAQPGGYGADLRNPRVQRGKRGPAWALLPTQGCAADKGSPGSASGSGMELGGGVSLGPVQHPGRESRVCHASQRSRPGAVRSGCYRSRANPGSTDLGLAQAQLTSYGSSWKEDLPRVRTDILCQGWGDPQGPPCRTQETRGPLHGSSGVSSEGGVSSRDGARETPCSPRPDWGLQKMSPGSRAGQTPRTQGKDSTIDQGVGSATSSFPELPREGGPALGSPHAPGAEGHEEVTGDAQAPARLSPAPTLGLHRGCCPSRPEVTPGSSRKEG